MRQRSECQPLKALYGKDEEDLTPGSIDSLYREATGGGSTFIRNDIKGEFDRTLALMLNEEMLNLVAFKYSNYRRNEVSEHKGGKGGRESKLPVTRLDRMVRLAAGFPRQQSADRKRQNDFRQREVG